MKKMLVLLAVLAFAGSAFAADADVDVTITIAEYLVVTPGADVTVNQDATYDATGTLYIGAVVEFWISSNAAWTATATADAPWVTSNYAAAGAANYLFSNNVAVNRVVHMSEGRDFSTTVLMTVTN
jgi:hypothetical protein